MTSRLSPRDRLRVWLLRRIAGERIVMINCRVIGDVHVEPHHPLGGEALIINCYSTDGES